MSSYSIRRALTVDERNPLSSHSDLLAHLLFHRGFIDVTEANKFLAPDYVRDTHDPFLLKDAEKAAERIISAIQKGEKIVIYADYDCDGVPGGAMWHDFFTRIGFKNFLIYIPHRHNEGFGVNMNAVGELAHQGVKLMVTLDCGISDALPIARAQELGIDVIVTDHHESPVNQSDRSEALPPAFAVVDPKRIGCMYPDKNICGTGVGFKMIQAILAKNRFGLAEGHEKWLLDLVGLATLSDMVPLTGENRVFAYYGMMVLRKSPRKGISQLLAKLKINQRHLTEDDLAFMVTPRINAASRMGVPRDALDLLTAETDEDARARAEHLNAINDERKGVVASLVKEVKKTVRERHGMRVPSVIVLGNPEWRPALLGLAANSCAEEFDRPVFLWGRDGGNELKGSCRSEGQSNVVELMRAVPLGVLTQFGGHHHSGGFTVAGESVHYLEQRLNEAAENMKQGAGSREKRRKEENATSIDSNSNDSHTHDLNASDSNADESDFIDAELRLPAVTSRLFDEVNRLAPFGVGNPKPVFLFKNITPIAVKRFGKGSEHVELSFNRTINPSAGNDYNNKLSAISFFGATSEWAEKVKTDKPIDLIASLEKSYFRGRPELRLRVVDVVCL